MRNEKDLTFDEFVAAVRNEDIRRPQSELKEEAEDQTSDLEDLASVDTEDGSK